jgi:hypothetical protein
VRVFCFSVASAIVLAVAAAGCGGGSSTTSAPLASRGIKGENPAREAATRAHLSSSDCAALRNLGEERLGTKLSPHSIPKPPLSRCRLEGTGASINIYLDTGFAANRRYHNRMEETVQFNAPDPDKVPHPVPHVGEKSAYNSAASWIPNLRSLLAVRGNRWLTVTISVKGRTDRELRDEAAVLARAGFELTAMG